jgi:UDP-glucose 4-epimerase
MDKVVVIGGSGFMGSHVADELSSRGYDVTIFDIEPSPWINKNQKMFEGDIQDLDALQKCIRDSRYVYQYAGIADIGESVDNPISTIKTNIMGTTMCLEACVRENVERFIYASTMYVYSDKGSFYRASKQSAEIIIESFQDKYDLDYTILRYGSLYGSRSQPWNGLRKYVTQAIKDNKILYSGTGHERREYIHVNDAANLSVKALDNKYKNMSLTITGTEILNSAELLTMIKEIIGKPIEIKFSDKNINKNDHYELSPYRYTPKTAKKIVSSEFTDIGQGILSLVEEITQEIKREKS